MLWQAYHVNNLVWEEIQAHFVAWHSVQIPMQNHFWNPPVLPATTGNDPAVAEAVAKVLSDMNRLGDAIVAKEYIANQPKPHHYQLIPVGD